MRVEVRSPALFLVCAFNHAQALFIFVHVAVAKFFLWDKLLRGRVDACARLRFMYYMISVQVGRSSVL